MLFIDNNNMREFVSCHRVTEKYNDFFTFQVRRGHGDASKGWAAKFIGTFDNIRDSKVSCCQRHKLYIAVKIFLTLRVL